MAGCFITFEGPEGSGKSTQARRLAERLRGLGYDVVTTREPGGTATGEAIRDILQYDAAGEPVAPGCEVLLFAASRAQLVQRVILPAIDRGAVVVCDRFADSTLCYQGFGRGFDVEKMIEINAFAIGRAVPDVTVLIDIDTARGFDRVARRNETNRTRHDRFEREDQSFHAAVRKGYLALAARWPERFRVIEGDQPEDTVADAVWRVVAAVVRAKSVGASE